MWEEASLCECECINFSRKLQHGEILRIAFENAVIRMLKSCRNADEVQETKDTTEATVVNVAIVEAGGLYQVSCWLKKLFHLKLPMKLNLFVVDSIYKSEKGLNFLNILKRCYSKQIKSRLLTVSAFDTYESLMEKNITFNLIIGIDVEHSTKDVLLAQWKTLIKGAVERVLIIRWSEEVVSDSRGTIQSFKVFSKGSTESLSDPAGFNTAVYEYSNLNIIKVAREVAKHIKTVSLL